MLVEDKLNLANKMCNRWNSYRRADFRQIYPFTTENIRGYIDEFDLKDKSLLTVGSSGDQAINAAVKGCKDITIIDKSVFSKEYYYLKKSAILNLSEEEYYYFLCYKNYPIQDRKNLNPLNDKSFDKILETLREEDEESYKFWVEIFKRQQRRKIREGIFIPDEDDILKLKRKNPYLDDYQETREIIRDLNPSFITSDIRKANLERKYDNIFLSNIFDYIMGREGIATIERILPHLDTNGKILLYYLYETSITGDSPEIEDLYDPSQVLYYIPFESQIHHFEGVRGMNKDENIRDGAIIYQKKK